MQYQVIIKVIQTTYAVGANAFNTKRKLMKTSFLFSIHNKH